MMSILIVDVRSLERRQRCGVESFLEGIESGKPEPTESRNANNVDERNTIEKAVNAKRNLTETNEHGEFTGRGDEGKETFSHLSDVWWRGKGLDENSKSSEYSCRNKCLQRPQWHESAR